MQDVPPKTVMVIEDDPDMLFMLDRALTDAGYVVLKSQTGSNVVFSSSLIPDVYILDGNSSNTKGFSICKSLRFNKETQAVPIIMISGYPSRWKARQAGVNKFISKPFDLRQLLRAIGKLTAATRTSYPAGRRQTATRRSDMRLFRAHPR